jgi:hypothetical protein
MVTHNGWRVCEVAEIYPDEPLSARTKLNKKGEESTSTITAILQTCGYKLPCCLFLAITFFSSRNQEVGLVAYLFF